MVPTTSHEIEEKPLKEEALAAYFPGSQLSKMFFPIILRDLPALLTQLLQSSMLLFDRECLVAPICDQATKPVHFLEALLWRTYKDGG